MSDENNNEPGIPFQKSMPTNETRSMPINSSGESPEKHLSPFEKLKQKEEK